MIVADDATPIASAPQSNQNVRRLAMRRNFMWCPRPVLPVWKPEGRKCRSPGRASARRP